MRQEWATVAAELHERRSRSRELAQQADLLRHGLTEIEAVDPAPGEDTDLTEQVKRLSAAEELREAATAAQLALTGSAEPDADAPGALGMLGEARRRLTGVEDAALRDLEPRLAEAAVLLDEVGGELASYLDSLELDPGRLDEVLARQAELKKLTRKYAADVDGVLAWADDARQRLSSMDTSEEALAELAERRDALATELAEHAARLSAARAAAAEDLGERITAELEGLAMGQAGITVAVRRRTADAEDDHAVRVDGEFLHAGPDGVDEVELRLRAHSGAQELPVHKAASGGELSRVMLAIEVVLAHADTVQTLVFDEVDAGVGGRAAVEIGRRLAMLARSHQVLVVTHLPQVAAFADRHLVVDKGSAEGVTRSGVRALESGERVNELARMLAGLEETETGRAHAEELLDAAAKVKETPGRGKAPGRGRSRAASRRSGSDG